MILIIGHEASFSGAPKFLLNYGKWLKEIKNEKIIFLLRMGGPLLKSYQEVARTFVCYYEPNDKNLLISVCNRIHNYFKKKILIFFLKKKNISLILSNTIVNGDILKEFRSSGIPIISRIPELEYVIKIYEKYNLPQWTLKYSDHFIAVSQAVKNNLMNNHFIPENKIDVCYGFVNKLDNKGMPLPLNIREKMKIPSGVFLVGACGNLEWRKGYDLFINVAKHIIKESNRNDIYFLWIGGIINSGEYVEFIRECQLMDLMENIKITGIVADMNNYYKELDVFLMTSREDPFPLVNIEAGLYGVPIICFDKSGGSPEFVTKDIGYVVDYSDTRSMANKVIELYENRELLKKMGENILNKSKNFTIDALAQKIYDIIEKNRKLI